MNAQGDDGAGDDVFDNDLTGEPAAGARRRSVRFEAALLYPFGTQSNLGALISHCRRGEVVQMFEPTLL